MTTFSVNDCELDFGTFSLGGDWTLTIATDDDGRSFKLVDAESCLKGVSKRCFSLIEEWVEDDVAPRSRKANHTSRVRAAYDEAVWLSCPASEIAAIRADDLRDQSRAA